MRVGAFFFGEPLELCAPDRSNAEVDFRSIFRSFPVLQQSAGLVRLAGNLGDLSDQRGLGVTDTAGPSGRARVLMIAYKPGRCAPQVPPPEALLLRT